MINILITIVLVSRVSFGLTREMIMKEYLMVVKYCETIVKALIPDRERHLIENTYERSVNNLIYLITRTNLQQNKTVCQNSSTL